MSKFYITTPIYYANDVPHIGHAYTTIAADILARYHRMKGESVFFLTGADENAQKNVESALRGQATNNSGLTTRQIVQSYVDEMSAKWRNTWDVLNISNDDFIRTTEPRHIEYVKSFWKKVKAKGDIYKATYDGLYCVGCESYKTESELIGGKCPDHKRAPKKLKEENYFFRLSKYRDRLLKYIEAHPSFIQPKTRRNEIKAYIKEHAVDFSISRKNLEWGIPVPGDKTQTIYVWFDALLNYVSAVTPTPPESPPPAGGEISSSPPFQGGVRGGSWWPANLHLMAKDIIKFHCAYWPAMLMSAGMPLPKTIFAHGFFTVDSQKMSKTIGNVVNPVDIAKQYGNDVLRYYLFREIPFGEDGDFCVSRLNERYSAELANGVGNLVARVLAMIEKYSGGKIPAAAKCQIKVPWSEYEESMESYALDKALALVTRYVTELNRLIDREKPWELAKTGNPRLNAVLYTLAESLRHVAWALYPFTPETSKKIFEQLGLGKSELKGSLKKAQKWGGLKKGTRIHKGAALFPRLTS